MVRIEGPKSTGAVGKTDKTKKTGSSSGVSFADLLTGEDEASSVSAPLATSGVSALWSLQAAGDATEKEERRRAVQYGDDLLDELDNLRLSLLTGNYTMTSLQNLSQRLAGRRVNLHEPHLLEMLDEIELRVQVELAKYGL